MITTASMVRLGKVYENMMVDLKLNSNKLEERAKRVLMILTGVDRRDASRFLRASGGHVKTAIIMIKLDIPADEAKARLERARGFLSEVLNSEIQL